MMSIWDTQLARRATAREMAEELDRAKRSFSEGMAHLQTAKKQMGIFGRYAGLPGPIGRAMPYLDNLDAEYKEMDMVAWRWFFSATEIRNRMSDKRWRETEQKIEHKELPEFTAAEALRIFESYADNAGNLFAEAIREVFEWLRPGHWRCYKTNEANRYEIGERIIKEWIVERGYSGKFNVRHQAAQNILCLDRAFHLLDGQPTPDYPGNFVTIARRAMEAGDSQCTTPYFEAKWYKNGNMHIRLLRDDLRQELNRIGADGRLELVQRSA